MDNRTAALIAVTAAVLTRNLMFGVATATLMRWIVATQEMEPPAHECPHETCLCKYKNDML